LNPADLARLGDRFFRVPGSGADGSGLGWSIVRRLAERYRFQVQLERSAELGGLRVVLTWPVA
jgi:two-component system sensor histidine kinase QseC